MKIIMSVLQVVLTLWTIVGGVYMMGHYQLLASTWALNTLPMLFWIILGVIQIALSVGLLISVRSSLRRFAFPSAVGLALVSLLGVVVYVAYTDFPGMLWSIIPAVLFAFVAYSRRTERV